MQILCQRADAAVVGGPRQADQHGQNALKIGR